MAGAGIDWTFSELAQDSGWSSVGARLVALILSLGGLLLTALLLSLVSDTISDGIEELRKAPFPERGHTLILG